MDLLTTLRYVSNWVKYCLNPIVRNSKIVTSEDLHWDSLKFISVHVYSFPLFSFSLSLFLPPSLVLTVSLFFYRALSLLCVFLSAGGVGRELFRPFVDPLEESATRWNSQKSLPTKFTIWINGSADFWEFSTDDFHIQTLFVGKPRVSCSLQKTKVFISACVLAFRFCFLGAYRGLSRCIPERIFDGNQLFTYFAKSCESIAGAAF